jgi:hypothetical protein
MVQLLCLLSIHRDFKHIFNVLNKKIDCLSIMDTVSLRESSKLITDFSIFSVSKALGSSPSARLLNRGQ